MIVADTNVLSEPLRPQPDHRVIQWLAAHAHELAITTVTVAELRYGVYRLPVGRRRHALDAAVTALVAQSGDRLLSFGPAAAEHYAAIHAERESRGVQAGVEDTMIAAICKVSDYPIATRNVADFQGAGIPIINPFESPT